MRLSVEQYALALQELSQKDGVAQTLTNFRAFLKRKGEESRLPSILTALLEREEESRGVLTLDVYTKHTASEETKKNVQRKAEELFPGKKVTLEYKEDIQVLGGFRLQGKDVQYDQSLAKTLKNISQTLKS